MQWSQMNRQENEMPKEILSWHGAAMPNRLTALSHIATVSILDAFDGGVRLQVTMPDATDHGHTTDKTTNSPCTSLYASIPSSSIVPRSQSMNGGPCATTMNDRTALHPDDLDAPQTGIDFVLSLEQPCLGHTWGNPLNGSCSGHALTAQAPLLTAAPPAVTTSSSWKIPAVEIERLLVLSPQLNLLGEVTPVQAWSRIRTYPGFERMTKDHLEALKYALVQEVQCYG